MEELGVTRGGLDGYGVHRVEHREDAANCSGTAHAAVDGFTGV